MAGIDSLRDRMDEVTLEMMRLLRERAEIAGQIGRLKRSEGRAVTDESREGVLRGKVAAVCAETGLDRGAAARLLNLLLNESVRIQSAGAGTHLSVFHRAREMERAGRSIIHMEVGEPDWAPPREAGDALAEAFGSGMTRYGGPAGTPELRAALAARAKKGTGAPVGADNVMVSPGARFSVFAAITTLLDPGDEIIVIEPAWPAYRDCAMHAGVKVRTVHATLEDGWTPDPAEVAAAAGPGARMLVMNYPNNPTGRILPRGIQDELMGIAADRGMYVLSDEIYADYAGEGWRSALEYGHERTVVTQSFSKSHAMTGFRVGCAIAAAPVIGRMSGLASLCLTSVPAPVQHAALRALDADTSWGPRTVRARLGTLESEAAGLGLEFARPDGAMYLFARAPGIDGTELAGRALEAGVAVAPGEGFGGYRDFVRLSACQDDKTLIEGMNILGRIMGGLR